MNVLVLNPYHGGSHRAFLDGWIKNSRHEFTVLTLPAHKWKWRMRHSAVTFAEQTAEGVARDESWDAVFCTDMLNLAEFRGLCCPSIRNLPAVVYFHENQLTYPNQRRDERDLHFAYTNFTTALAADRVWFNSEYHRNDFLSQLGEFLGRMPDHQHASAVERLREKSEVQPPGVDFNEFESAAHSSVERNTEGPLRIVWAARWEHDKNPATFFSALEQLAPAGTDFRVSVLGQSFGDVPNCFAQARKTLADKIDHWGHLDNRRDYIVALQQSDVVVSTALHEFFGIAIVEAVAAGCIPLVPRRLAYPEVLEDIDDFFHDGTADHLASRLTELAVRKASGKLLTDEWRNCRRQLERFEWNHRAVAMDASLDELR